MSSGPSSRETSPRPPPPPSSDSEDDTRSSTRLSLHPSSSIPSNTAAPSSSAPVLQQPVGSSGNTSTTMGSSAQEASTIPSQQHPPGQDLTEHRQDVQGDRRPNKRPSKGKEKEKDKSKKQKVKDSRPLPNQPQPQPQPQQQQQQQQPQPQVQQHRSDGATPLSSSSGPTGFEKEPSSTYRSAFRVRPYANDPAANVAPFPRATGPYTSDFRANSTTASSVPIFSQYPHPASQEQPKRSYYRHDYERQRDNAPNRQGKTHESTAIPASHVDNNSSSTYSQNQYPSTSNSAPHHTNNTLRRDVNAAASSYTTPGPESDYPMYDQTSTHVDSAVPSSRAPSSGAGDHHDHHKSRRHGRQVKSYDSNSSAAPRSIATSGPYAPPSRHAIPSAPAPRVLRILTLLIEDRRPKEPENILAEIFVPLKQADNPEDGFWADAKEVCDELQRSTSRIDGRAKVCTMRGKWRQYFLRVSPENGNECDSVNLMVSKERTLTLFVDFYPPPIGTQVPVFEDPRAPPSRYQRALLTPVTDSIASSSPRIAPRSGSAFSFDRYEARGREYESDMESHKSRKRRRSTSSRSAVSEMYARQRSRYSPSPPRTYGSPSPQSSPAPTHSQIAHPLPHSRDSYTDYVPPPAHYPQTSGTYASHYNHSSYPHNVQRDHRPSRSQSPAIPNPPRSNKAERGAADGRMISQPERVQHSWRHSRTPSIPGGLPSTSSAPGLTLLSQTSSAFDNTSRTASTNTYSSSENRAPHTSAPPNPEVDNIVSTYLRSIVCQRPGWDEFVKGRSSILRMSEQLKQYHYMKSNFDKFVNTVTPSDLAGAANVSITRAHVLRAFNLPTSWGDDCMEVLALTSMYGRAGKRYEDSNVMAMLDEVPPISTGLQLQRFLALLRAIHSKWTIEHPDY